MLKKQLAQAGGTRVDARQKPQTEFRTVVMAGLEVLKHHPQHCPRERLRRYLRTAQV
jgi:hypothetical protein